MRIRLRFATEQAKGVAVRESSDGFPYLPGLAARVSVLSPQWNGRDRPDPATERQPGSPRTMPCLWRDMPHHARRSYSLPVWLWGLSTGLDSGDPR